MNRPSINKLIVVLGLLYFSFFFYLMLISTEATAVLSRSMVLAGVGVSFGWFAQSVVNRRSAVRNESLLRGELHDLGQQQKDQFERIKKQQDKSLVHTQRLIKKQTDTLYRRLEALSAVRAEVVTERAMPSLSGWALFPDSALLLVGIVKESKPKTVLDLGSGASTILCGHLVKGYQGKVHSVDHDKDYLEKTQKTVTQHSLDSVVDLIHAPLKTRRIKSTSYKWYDLSLKEVGEIDLLIVDGPPGGTQKHARYPALPAVYDKLSKDAVVVVDDYGREDEQWMVSEWLKQFKDFELQVFETEKGVAVLRRKH